MNNPLPLFNWSLKKAQDTEPDSLDKARVGILYTILLFSLLKIVIVLVLGSAYGQWLQVIRAAIAFVFYISMLKALLYRPRLLKPMAHLMLVIGSLIIWSNIFVYVHGINLPTIQFVFMVVLSSFYTLGTGLGIMYSVMAIIPVLLSLIFKGNYNMFLTSATQEFVSPGFEIIVVLNFISIMVCHYLFFRAFNVSIQEKERLNQQLKLSIAEANKLATSKSNFLSTISHELRTPLNSVVGITELLLADRPEARHAENLKILQFSAHDLLSLINNVLDFNKIDSDKLVLESVPFQLAEFMRNICSGLKIKADDKKLSFVLDIDKQLEQTTIIGDPTRLSQVIYNLVGNAIKFTDKGGITVKVDCVHKSELGMDIQFSVADTGLGIHPERHESIFELFTQAESHITRRYGGTGLGLAIVKQILTLLNSNVELESAPGKGSRFVFTISVTTAAADTGAVVNKPDAKPDFGHLNILIAEDIGVNRLIMKKQLDMMNVQPIMVENGKEAYETFVAGDYDAIFMDLHMPVLDGYETTKQIRALKDSTKASVFIVAFTASVTEGANIAETGFDDFLYKPVNMKDLRDKLEKISLRSTIIPIGQ